MQGDPALERALFEQLEVDLSVVIVEKRSAEAEDGRVRDKEQLVQQPGSQELCRQRRSPTPSTPSVSARSAASSSSASSPPITRVL